MSITDYATIPQYEFAVRSLPVPRVNWNPWTVGDMDRVRFIAANRRDMTAESVVAKLAGTALACDVAKVRLLCREFNIFIRPSLYEAQRRV